MPTQQTINSKLYLLGYRLTKVAKCRRKRVKGSFSRRGRSRTGTRAADHDFKPEATLTPFGIFLPEHDDLWLYTACSKVASDFIVDRLEQWWQEVRLRFLRVRTLVINLDNGPECHSRRTQFLKRIVGSPESTAW